MNRDQKAELISSLKESLTASPFVAIIHYRGMTDKQLYDMRVALKAKKCSMKIAKNTLVKVAIKGTGLESISSHLSGPTAVLYSQDVIALSKVISDFSKEVEVLKIKIGYLNNELISETKIRDLAKLGSLEEVRASFLGKLKGAQSNFVRILKAPESGMASSFNS
ncbi:MAG: 50S ribosomal protein L10 [Pelagibacterales bacterium]|nr:50S ribosomal protein L10 [Pelagibacterales bacterium]